MSGQASQYLAGFINVEFPEFGIPPRVLVIEILVGILVPLLAALVPVFRGTRITVREALADYGIGKGRLRTRQGLLRRLFRRAPAPASDAAAPRPSRLRSTLAGIQAAVLPRPVLLSLRNAFRHRLRMLLTLVGLTVKDVYGGYEKQVFDWDAPRMLIVCEK